jgi:hypothetical protein
MALQGSDDVLYLLYFCALNNIQLILVCVARCFLVVSLNSFDIFLPMLGDGKKYEVRLMGIGIGDILFVGIYDKTH